MIANNFAVFILTHGRPNNVITYRTLRKGGYTGAIYIIVDNEDSTIDEYKKNFGDKVIVFDKKAVADRTDTCDNFSEHNTVLYARNACFDIARDLGIDYFIQLDDDYTNFRGRLDENLIYKYIPCTQLDDIFCFMLKFYKSIDALSIAFSQGGDFVGGGSNPFITTLKMKRKAMNSFFCSVKRPFKFIGRMNDDVNTYMSLGNRGGLFLTIFNISIEQKRTQAQPGGLTDMYLKYGTYIKSFYTVMQQPSCIIVRLTYHDVNPRLHHYTDWNRAVPKIIDEKHCKRLTPAKVKASDE